jgi:glycosyltransferase involved in cell wall biosynthesis
MRILYLSKYAANPNYGRPTRQFFYCKYLSRIAENEVMLVSSRSTGDNSIPAFRGRVKYESFGRLTHAILNGPTIGLGFNFRRVFSWLWFEIQILRSFRNIRRWKPDVIFVSSLSLLTFLTGIIFKWILRIPLVVEVRDIYPLTQIEVGGFSRWNPAVVLLGWVEKMGYRHSDAIVSSLPNLGPHVKERIGQSKPVTYLPMGFDPEFFESSEPSEKGIESIRKIDQSNAGLSVGYCGTIGLANALKEPLQAFYSLVKKLPDAHLWIIGDGPLRAKYENEFGSASNIHFLGHHPKTDLPHLLAKFDVVINPWMNRSIYRFGISPNKWIDYMVAAKPILVSYNGYRFLIEEEKIGWIVPPEDEEAFRDAIVRLSTLPRNEMIQLGKNGRSYLEKHLSYEKLACQLNELLNRLVSTSSTK